MGNDSTANITNKTGKELVRDENGRVVAGVLNPNGRPKKGQTLTDIMREVLEESLPSGVSRKEALVRKVLESAYNGNESMIRLAWNYLDGMPVQKTELTGGEGEDLSIKLVTYGSTPTISNESTTQTDTI